MGLDIENSIEMEFSDGRFVVPSWWARMPSFIPVGYIDGIRVVPYTLDEARKIVNNDLDVTAVRQAMKPKKKDKQIW
jgi:hypothetical protein